MSPNSNIAWPRLAVISDVVPTRTVGGELLLYRLLAGWPSDRLSVVCGNLTPDLADRGLPAVQVERLTHTVERLHRTRFRPYLNYALFQSLNWLGRRVSRALGRFTPDAILTVAHNHLCLAAASVARARQVPLFVISHDEWTQTVAVPRWAAAVPERAFARLLKQAECCLCVSPNMADDYQSRYGANVSVLYPNRGDDSPPAKLRAKPRDGLVVGYAGSLFGTGYLDLLGELAGALEPVGGRLVVYTQHALGPLAERPNVVAGGFVPSAELADRLGEVADALFVPMSFRPEDRRTATLAFPSKLADYTAIGLPLLVCGPEYCSAARWMAENPGVGELVVSPERGALADAIRRLSTDPAGRVEMARHCMAAGERDFSLAVGRRLFEQVVCGGHLVGRNAA